MELEKEFSITAHRPLSVYECNNNKEIMILDFEYQERLHLLFYDIKTKNEITKISGFSINKKFELWTIKWKICNCWNVWKILYNYLIDHSIYKSIQLQYDYFITCALKLDNKNLFFSDDRGNIYEFEIDDKDINIKFKDIFAAHGNSPIYQLAKYQENNILSSGLDGKIRVWKLTWIYD